MYTYKYIISHIYRLKLNLIFTSLFINALLCLISTSLLVELKLRFEIELFAK